LFESDFLTSATTAAYRKSIDEAIDALRQALPAQPYSGKSPQSLASLFEGDILPDNGLALEQLWNRVRNVISESVIVTHPHTIAHLHCPPLIVAQAVEVVINALNQSMDSFDQAPAATMLEEKLVAWLCHEVRLGAQAGGVFTSGGTQSNYMGLLLARDSCVEKNWNCSVQSQGLPADARGLRILCSDLAHFTVEKSAAQLGLGTEAVVRIPTDESFGMRSEMLQQNRFYVRLDQRRP
jgi:L-2,4-diaminobutyrate decarboxylase